MDVNEPGSVDAAATVVKLVAKNPREFDFDKYFFGEAFAYWLFFGFLRRRVLAPMKPLTVEDLIRHPPLGRWPV